MIAIFNKAKDAADYSDLVHAHLTANRGRYNAVRWSNENKHSKKNEWGVKLPPDLDKLKPIKPDHLAKSIRQDEKYADGWEDDQGEDQQ